jgi:hypothetical protein
MILLLATGIWVALAAPPAGGPVPTGPLTVLQDAVSLRRVEGGIELSIPVQTRALAPSVSLKVTAELLDAEETVHAQSETLATVSTGPATLRLILDVDETVAPQDLRLQYRVRCLHPPAEVSGTAEVRTLLTGATGGPPQRETLRVLEGSITLRRIDGGVDVAIPVQVNVLTPSVTLKAQAELVDSKGRIVGQHEIDHVMPSGPATVAITVPTSLPADELKLLTLRYTITCAHPPAEARGELPLEGTLSAMTGGPAATGVVRVMEEAVSLRTVDAGLRVSLPIHTRALTQTVTVKVTAELLDVNDSVVSAHEVSQSVGAGPATVTLTLPTSAGTEGLLPLRLRYRVRSLHPPGETSGVLAVSEFLSVPEVILMGEDTYLSGSHASVRILALDHTTRLPLEGSDVTVSLLLDQGKELPLFRGHIDAAGTVSPSFDIPAGLEGTYTLRAETDTPLGSQVIERPMTIESHALVLLVTDKPTYQPGQTIFSRILCLRRPTREAVAGADAELRIEDPKGNVVLRRDLVLDAMGVGAAEFTLADYVSLGRYVVKATVGSEMVEKTVQVERYVLPKFEVELTTDRPYYQPGTQLTADLKATYFFGKPVAGGKVSATLKKFDVGPEVFQEVQGTLDEDGAFAFTAQLPSYFVGIPLDQGDARVEVEVSVTDGAGHEERTWRSFPVTKAPLVLRVLPESGDLVGGVPNTIHVAVSYPDGAPVSGTVSVTAGQQRFWVETDELGLASFEVTVQPNTAVPLVLLATDQKGQKAGAEYVLSPSGSTEALLLRPSRALAKVGEPLTLRVISNGPSRVAYLDLIKDGQTVLTRSIPMEDGEGTVEIVPDAGLSGTVWAHAYQVVSSGDMVRDTRAIYVDPANDLSLAVSTDSDQYAPGSPGEVSFSVTDAAGAPVVAALGVAIVDEAVFARTEMRPGLEKVYFTLEEEIAKPRFEIHGFEAPLFVMGKPPADEVLRRLWGGRERAAEVMFASLTVPAGHAVEVNTFKEAMDALRETFLERMGRDWEEIWRARQEYQRSRRRLPVEIQDLVEGGFLKSDVTYDMWGQPYTWQTADEGHWFELHSAGPDKVAGTSDDLMYEGEDRVRRFKVMGKVVGVVPRAPFDLAAEQLTEAGADVSGAGAAEPRVREYFPETMLFEPRLITDRAGLASLGVRWPDSITEWRLTAAASSAAGELGSAVEGVTVFQPFFVDLDLPVALTQGDEVWVPVAIYNYLEKKQTVRLVVQEDPWFELLEEADKEKLMAPGEVDYVRFHLKAVSLGTHALTVKAYGGGVSDAVSRPVRVVPNGREHIETFSDRLAGQAERTVSFPPQAITGASKLVLRVLPGVMSQVVEGLQSIFRMPFGCFEQTSSITYPNVMVLDYMRRTGNINPELEMTAEEYINLGYQRLLAYEVEGGGFEWFGNAPANVMLSAYGLMEFYDMSRVYEVDPRVLQRTGEWILSKQEEDGHWDPDPEFLHAESWAKIQRSEILPTAYALCALQRAGFAGAQTQKGLDYVKRSLKNVEDPYALALCANALAAEDTRSDSFEKAIDMLVKAAVQEGDVAYWRSAIPTFAGAREHGADIETTALALLGLLKHGGHSGLAEKVLTYLIRSRDSAGTWHTTQGTVLVLQALLERLETAGRREATGTLIATVDGEEAGRAELTEENREVVQVIDLTEHLVAGTHVVRISLDGEGECAYDLVGTHYIPWTHEPGEAEPVLLIEVSFDKTELEESDLVTQTVRVKNQADRPAKMVLVDVGLPPGFSPQIPDLEELVGTSIQKYELTGRQVIVYLERLAEHEEVVFSYRLKARFPMRASSGVCRVYEYYNPDDVTVSSPMEMTVREAS